MKRYPTLNRFINKHYACSISDWHCAINSGHHDEWRSTKQYKPPKMMLTKNDLKKLTLVVDVSLHNVEVDENIFKEVIRMKELPKYKSYHSNEIVVYGEDEEAGYQDYPEVFLDNGKWRLKKSDRTMGTMNEFITYLILHHSDESKEEICDFLKDVFIDCNVRRFAVNIIKENWEMDCKNHRLDNVNFKIFPCERPDLVFRKYEAKCINYNFVDGNDYYMDRSDLDYVKFDIKTCSCLDDVMEIFDSEPDQVVELPEYEELPDIMEAYRILNNFILCSFKTELDTYYNMRIKVYKAHFIRTNGGDTDTFYFKSRGLSYETFFRQCAKWFDTEDSFVVEDFREWIEQLRSLQ